jgi:glycosyltransferase involved in cell wall biosynthesis
VGPLLEINNMKPYISVIIPCLNEEHFLPKLLKNLNSQTFKKFEVIVVDGNSTDKTAEVVTKFKSNYPLQLVSTEVRNVSFQRNLGAKNATGKVLIFFDADTQIPKDYLQKITLAFQKKHPHFLSTYISVDSKKPSDKMFASFTNLVFEIGLLIKIPSSYGAMQAVTKKAFFDVGGYDPKTKFGEDSQLFQKLSDAKYKFIILKDPRYIFSLRRFHSEGTLKSLGQYLQLNLNILLRGYYGKTKITYQMGGHRYQNKLK